MLARCYEYLSDGCVSNVASPLFGDCARHLKVNRIFLSKLSEIQETSVSVPCFNLLSQKYGGRFKHRWRVACRKWHWEEEIGRWCSTAYTGKEKSVHIDCMVRPQVMTV